MMLITLRKGTAAAHYVMGGPTANRHNAFTLGVATTEIYVMHGETAAAASYSRRLVKEKDAGRPLEPIIEKMNTLAREYHDNSRPAYCAKHGMVDEVVKMKELRNYLKAFAGCAYQNPKSTPRIIRG
jgi:glutaconyl-CoA decarboxylase